MVARNSLQVTADGPLTPARQTCLDVLSHSLTAVDAFTLTSKQVSATEGALVIGGQYFALDQVGKIYVAAMGKCSYRQSQAVTAAVMGTPFADKVTGMAITAKDEPESLGPIKVVVGRHQPENVPSLAAVDATRQLIQQLAQLQPNDLVVFLISGGASALLVLPEEGVSLQDMIETTRQLHLSGCSIQLVNQTRTLLSQVKGGGLLNFLPTGVQATALLISDVVGDEVATIGSGPTGWRPRDYEAGWQELQRAGVGANLPSDVVGFLQARARHSSLPPGQKVRNLLVGNSLQGLRHGEAYARQLGYQVLDGADLWEGDGFHFTQFIAQLARNVLQRSLPVSPPVCFLFGGETTLQVQGDPAALGKGGRNQHMALLFAKFAEEYGLDPERVVFASLGTDGEDGATDVAGAMVGGTSEPSPGSWPELAAASLRRFDSYGFFQKNGGHLRCPVHATNVMDFRILLIT